MQTQEKDNYGKFIDAFYQRYKEELKQARLVLETEMLQLYMQFKGSGKTPEQWFEQQELR